MCHQWYEHKLYDIKKLLFTFNKLCCFYVIKHVCYNVFLKKIVSLPFDQPLFDKSYGVISQFRGFFNYTTVIACGRSGCLTNFGFRWALIIRKAAIFPSLGVGTTRYPSKWYMLLRKTLGKCKNGGNTWKILAKLLENSFSESAIKTVYVFFSI